MHKVGAQMALSQGCLWHSLAGSVQPVGPGIIPVFKTGCEEDVLSEPYLSLSYVSSGWAVPGDSGKGFPLQYSTLVGCLPS